MQSVDLYCVPHAGGSAYYYMRLNRRLRGVRAMPLELAGRGGRYGEPSYSSIRDAALDVYRRLANLSGDYSLLGHSMGAIIAYEALVLLAKEGRTLPRTVFLSGSGSPCAKKSGEHFAAMTDARFIDYLAGIGGIDPELFRDKSIAAVFLPILRLDFSLISDYQPTDPHFKIGVNAVISAGESDTLVSESEMARWGDFFSGVTTIHRLNGGHFYDESGWGQLSSLINSMLLGREILLYGG